MTARIAPTEKETADERSHCGGPTTNATTAQPTGQEASEGHGDNDEAGALLALKTHGVTTSLEPSHTSEHPLPAGDWEESPPPRRSFLMSVWLESLGGGWLVSPSLSLSLSFAPSRHSGLQWLRSSCVCARLNFECADTSFQPRAHSSCLLLLLLSQTLAPPRTLLTGLTADSPPLLSRQPPALAAQSPSPHTALPSAPQWRIAFVAGAVRVVRTSRS